MSPTVSASTIRRWAGALWAGLTQGLGGPALQLAMQAQMPALAFGLAFGLAPDGRAESIACASRVASLKGVQA